MRIKLATDNDEMKWDSFVSSHKNASPYHRFAWKKAIEKSYSHKCFYLIAEDDGENLLGILPSVLITPPLVTGQLCSLPFCDRGEALGINSEVEQELIHKAHEIAISNNSIYEYRASGSLSDSEHLNSSHKVSMLLKLPESSERLLQSFTSKLRSQIRKAKKNGLTYEIGQSGDLINDFYHVLTINMRDLGSPTHSKKWFEEIQQNYKENMIISIVRLNDEAIGAGIVLLNGSVASIPWASTIRKFNKLSPNMLLYWSFLKYASDNGYDFFDFGRSSYGEGTFKFKQQWGAKPQPLIWKKFREDKARNPVEQSQKKSNIRSTLETVWSHLPLAMTVFLGSRIRKYISL